MHWIFATKYWIISREVPRLFEGGQLKFQERTYLTIQICGFVLNLVPCIIEGYFRAQLSLQSTNGDVPPVWLTRVVNIFY